MNTENWSSLEWAIMINAREMATLVGIFGDLDGEDAHLPLPAIQQAVISFVDLGLVELRRYEPWIAPGGRLGEASSGLLSREEQLAELLDADNWDVVAGDAYVGAVTLVETAAGRALVSKPPAETS